MGDQVKFLNTTGGGVVTKIIDTRMVLVADQDGFEVPTLNAELIKIDPTDAGGRFFREEFSVPSSTRKEMTDRESQATESGTDAGVGLLDPRAVRTRTSEDIFLAFIPHDQKWMIAGMLDICLINNTSYDVIYNIFHRTSSGHYTGADYGSLVANSKYIIATVNRESLSDWTEGSLQFLFHKEHLDLVVPPFDSDFQIDGKKFHKEGAYKETSLLKEKGIVIRLLSLTSYIEEARAKSNPVASVDSGTPAPDKSQERPIIFTHQSEPRKAIVDLHIHELVEDPSNLQKNEILEFQRNYFIRCLDAAMANNFINVIFIHGVGDGILRGVLTGYLEKTEGIEWFDAPMALYGVGAIEVRIPHNR